MTRRLDLFDQSRVFTLEGLQVRHRTGTDNQDKGPSIQHVHAILASGIVGIDHHRHTEKRTAHHLDEEAERESFVLAERHDRPRFFRITRDVALVVAKRLVR